MRGTISRQFGCGLHVCVVTSRTSSAVVPGSRLTATGAGEEGTCCAATVPTVSATAVDVSARIENARFQTITSGKPYAPWASNKCWGLVQPGWTLGEHRDSCSMTCRTASSDRVEPALARTLCQVPARALGTAKVAAGTA